MKIVYIAHPIGGDVKGNIKKIIRIVREINLTREDVVPLVPYLADVLALDDKNPEERFRGVKNGIAVLRSKLVSEVWIYGARISSGIRDEITVAEENNIPVVVMDPMTDVPLHLRPKLLIGY
jgi:hypothetical protein